MSLPIEIMHLIAEFSSVETVVALHQVLLSIPITHIGDYEVPYHI